MSRIILYALGIAWLLGSPPTSHADDAEDAAVKFFNGYQIKPAIVRDEKQPGSPVIGILIVYAERFDAQSLKDMFVKLADMKSLTEIVLLYWGAPDGQWTIDAEVKELARLKNLDKLYIFSNAKITDDGYKSIGNLNNLTTILLNSTNKITDNCMKELARLNNLNTLCLGPAGGTDQIDKDLTYYSSKLIESNRGTALFSFLKPEDQRKLLIEHRVAQEIDATSLKRLAPLKNLTTLALPGRLTDESLAELRKVKLLHILTLATDSKGKRPTKPEDVRALYLSKTGVTDAGLKELKDLKNLTTLTLPGRITDRTLAELRAVGLLHALPVATGPKGARPAKPEDVVALDLGKTGVTDAGLKELKEFKNLQSLSLTGTKVSDAWLTEMAPFKQLSIVSPAKVTDATLTAARKANLLHILSQATAANGTRPTKPEDVTAVDLSNTEVTAAGLKELAAFKNLTTLDLPGRVTDEVLAVLRNANLLHALSTATDEAGKRPTKPEEVVWLDLGKSGVTDAGLKELKDFKNLTTLTLPGRITDRTLAELGAVGLLHALPVATGPKGARPAKPEDVVALDLSKTHVIGVGLKELAAFKNLTTLELPGKVTDEVLAGLGEANLLHTLPRATDKAGKRATKPEDVASLYLSLSKVTDKGLKELAPLKNLTTLSLGETKITDEGLKELASLKELTTLYLFQTKVTDKGVGELRKALPKCKIVR